jgi:hypothetical protein
MKPRIYGDFNKWEGDGKSRWLILTCKGTVDDLIRLNLKPLEGMEVTFYMDDLDKTGKHDDLQADGHFHFDDKANCWVGLIDWNSIRHASG